ncbi:MULTISPECIES: hypothetical protein [Enterobacterales]|uniref:Uncharacterized protein n=7 Tax=Enterobacteriaceae TaxID=543 RepID=A0AAW9C294_KLUCR|nr:MULTISPECIES: hypothetical protein [Enterobacterales]MDM9661409.1 hypothetical protein [Raoultella planticola]MDU1358277.1 hypothetical protein [Citrobacter freundii]EFE7907274.1 hypothetical protein [Escherichia coli]EFM2411532.1 hypothetical protein [Escherichia coli]EKW4787431.1 hypothetical protein [Klebsiella variicola]
MVYTGITDHARLRLMQRSRLPLHVLTDMIDKREYVDLGSKPGILKKHILIYSRLDEGWYVLIRDITSGCIVTVLPENYHDSSFIKINESDKKSAYDLAFKVRALRPELISINLCYNDFDGYRHSKNIYSIPISQVEVSQESFLKSKFIKLLKRKIRENNARGLFFDEHTIEPGYTPLFLNVRFSPDKYKILYF